MEPESTTPTFRHNGQTEADFFIVMTFDADFDKTHAVCTWLMDAFEDSSAVLGFRMHLKDLSDQNVERMRPPQEPYLIATVHPKRKNQVAFCLHLCGNYWRAPTRSSSGKLSCYNFSSSGFVSVTDAGVRTESIMEAIEGYLKKQAPPANLLSCMISGIPGDVMKTVWWAMIGEDKGFMVHPMYGIIPGDTVREMSYNFGWEEYPPGDDAPGYEFSCFQEIADDE